jgi:hypothetical protein
VSATAGAALPGNRHWRQELQPGFKPAGERFVIEPTGSLAPLDRDWRADLLQEVFDKSADLYIAKH